MPYRFEISPNNRAGCQLKACKDAKDKIKKGEVRQGTWVTIPDGQGGTNSAWKWRHWGCISPSIWKNIERDYQIDSSLVEGLEDLPEAEVEKVMDALVRGHVPDADWKGDIRQNRPAGFVWPDDDLDTDSSPKKKRPAKKRGKKAADSDDDDEDDFEVKPKKKAPAKKRKAAAKDDDDDDDEEKEEEEVSAKPTKRSRKAKQEATADDSDAAPTKSKGKRKSARDTAAPAPEPSDAKGEDEPPKAKGRGRPRKAV